MVANGRWIDNKDRDPYKVYRKDCDWIERMFNLVEGKEQELLFSLKVFNSKTNTKGVIRDHKYSRKSGFNAKVFPEI